MEYAKDDPMERSDRTALAMGTLFDLALGALLGAAIWAVFDPQPGQRGNLLLLALPCATLLLGLVLRQHLSLIPGDASPRRNLGLILVAPGYLLLLLAVVTQGVGHPTRLIPYALLGGLLLGGLALVASAGLLWTQNQDVPGRMLVLVSMAVYVAAAAVYLDRDLDHTAPEVYGAAVYSKQMQTFTLCAPTANHWR